MKTLVLKYIDKKNISIITLIIAFLSRIIGGMITNKYLSYLPYINKHSFFYRLNWNFSSTNFKYNKYNEFKAS